MNRRSFVGRIAGAIAAASVAAGLRAEETPAPSVQAAAVPASASKRPSLTINRLPQFVRPVVDQGASAEPKTILANTDSRTLLVSGSRAKAWTAEDRHAELLRLHHERGLVKPCGGCGAKKWTRIDGFLTCACGWKEMDRLVLLPCACPDCTHMASNGSVTEELDVSLLGSAPVGTYWLTEHGRRITRTEQNQYDVTLDVFFHDVVMQQGARIRCGISLRNGRIESNVTSQQACEFRPNGDQVVIGWAVVDCHEWQQEAR